MTDFWNVAVPVFRLKDGLLRPSLSPELGDFVRFEDYQELVNSFEESFENAVEDRVIYEIGIIGG